MFLVSLVTIQRPDHVYIGLWWMFHQIFPPLINLIKTDRNKTRQIVSDKSQDVLPRPITAHIASANHSTNQDHATYPDQSARTRHEPHGYKYRTQFHARHSGSERDQSNNSPEGPTRTTSDHHLGPALGRRSELSDHPLGSTRTSLIYKYSVQ